MRPWSRCNHSIFSPATALPSIQGHGGVLGMSPSMSPLGSEAKGPVNFSSILSWCWAYLCCLTPHPAPNRVTMNTTFTVSRWLVLCWAHTLYAKPWANLLLAALIFPWVSGSPTQRLLLIKPWHTPHKALSRPKYNQRFNKYQNKTKKKNYHNTGSRRAMAATGGKQENTTKPLKGCGGQAETQLFLIPLSTEGGKLTSSTHPGDQPAVSHPFWMTANTLI